MTRGEMRWQAPANRWGPGRVHRYVWDRAGQLWYVACRGPERSDPPGRVVASDTPATCARCLALADEPRPN